MTAYLDIRLKKIFFISIVIWCFGIISPVLFQNAKVFIVFKPFLNKLYSAVCHQADEKTFKILGQSFLVCSRCTGIYVGVLIAAVSPALLSAKLNNFSLLLSSIFILLLDVILSTLQVYGFSKSAAFSTGLLFGFTLFNFIMNELFLFEEKK